MAWSSFAHLPNNVDEYINILNKLHDGMTLIDVDDIIAEVKGKTRVQHHYRSNLCHLGLFEIRDKCIVLNYFPEEVSDESVKHILKECVKRNRSKEIETIRKIIKKSGSYNLDIIASEIMKQDPYLEKQNLIRWIRPIVSLLKIIDCSMDIDEKQEYKECLQNAYLKIANGYGDAIALELIDNILVKNKPHKNVVEILQTVLKIPNIKYKIELLMKPAWASKCKAYKLNEDLFTHIKLKKEL